MEIMIPELGGRYADIPDQDLKDFDAFVRNESGRIRLMPLASWRLFDPILVRVWMHISAVYSIVTAELVEWLQKRIGDRHAIEIGAGNGDIYYHLNIQGTDSCLQRDPVIAAMYRAMGQIATNPRADIIMMDANTAVERIKPKVVVGSFIARRFVPGRDISGKSHASVYGVDDEHIIQHCEMYIHIGNRASHGEKTALSLPHEEMLAEHLTITRGRPENSVIYIWGN